MFNKQSQSQNGKHFMNERDCYAAILTFYHSSLFITLAFNNSVLKFVWTIFTNKKRFRNIQKKMICKRISREHRFLFKCFWTRHATKHWIDSLPKCFAFCSGLYNSPGPKQRITFTIVKNIEYIVNCQLSMYQLRCNCFTKTQFLSSVQAFS